jgi:hypothetical protein
MTSPIFDQRAAATYFADAVALARLYCPEWGLSADDAITPDAVAQDPGLALLKLFALIGQDLAQILNAIPTQRQLALYRFLDMRLRPPVCASAPICFSLAPKQAPVLLPKGTQVVNSLPDRLRFETDSDLQVLPATLGAVLRVAPRRDRYMDVQSLWANRQPAPIFPGRATNVTEQAFAHALLLGDATLFKPGSAPTGMTIRLQGQRLDPDYFQCWYDGAMKPLHPTVTGSHDGTSCMIAFTSDAMPGSPLQTVTALHASISAAAGLQLDITDPSVASCPTTPLYWLVCNPVDEKRVVPALNGYLPRIDTIWCDLGTLRALPQQAAAGGAVIDLKNGAYAFGQAPGLDTAFSIRCDDAFSREFAPVKMTFDLRPLTSNPTAVVAWQYWDGTQWSAFSAVGDPQLTSNPYQFVDTTQNLAVSGTVSFICPAIRQTSISGNEGTWIRAVIQSGNYGEQSTGILPPFVRSLVIDYQLGGVPASMWAHNAFALDALQAAPYTPYRPLAEEGTSVYLAFDASDLIAYGLGQRLTLYADIDPADEHVGHGDTGAWQWFDAASAAWQPLAIEIGEAGLARSGKISFTVPPQLQASVFFSKTACWFRILCPQGKRLLRLRGLYPNTINASNRTTYRNQTLGSSNGQPGQRFALNRLVSTAAGKDQVLLAVSSDPQYAVQLQVIEPAISESIALDAGQSQQTIPYEWTRVDSLVGQGPHDRVFAVDVAAGAVVFGDGRQGRIPPPGSNNIIATCYATTRGAAGNIAAGGLTTLYAAAPGITQVTNPVAAFGGADADSVDELTDIAPGLVRANDRVVSAADAQALAYMSNAGVCQVRAIEHAFPSMLDDPTEMYLVPEHVGGLSISWPARHRPRLELVVLAKAADPEPLTPMSMLDDVLAYVRARSMPSLAARTTARRPTFKRIDAAVLLQTNAPKSQWPALQTKLAEQLTQFLHPALGGEAGRGWAIGEPVRYVTMRAFLLGVDASVTSVMALALCGQASDVALEPHEAPSAGSFDIRLAEAPQT